MKKLTSIVTLLLLVFVVLAGKPPVVPEVILIGVGEKNPTFNESLYPHLKFYYTPGLQSQAAVGSRGKSLMALTGSAIRESFVGDPKFLQDVNDEFEMKGTWFIFDKNGVCYNHGYDIGRRGEYLKIVGVNKKSTEIGDTFIELMKKDKTAKLSAKNIVIRKNALSVNEDFLIGQKMPEYKVYDLKNESVSIKSITESGKPVILIFFQLPSDIDMQEAKESGAGKTGKQFGAAIAAGAAGATLTGMCETIESEFFGYDARENM
ncbi:MAG: hypothetical protein ACI9DM_000320 [Cyclobacteriaceae bacterium]|jgi:hypothetical protein